MKHARTVRSLMIAGTMGAVALQSIIPASAANAGAESYIRKREWQSINNQKQGSRPGACRRAAPRPPQIVHKQ